MEYLPPLWVRDAIFYEIFPDRFANGDKNNDPHRTVEWGKKPTRRNFFGGDLKGIMDNVDYFKEININAIYLTPIFKANTNHKYDTQDYYSIDPTFGSKEDFKKLVNTLHKNGIKIILDGVFNHCGDSFWAFKDVLKNGESSIYKNWFNLRSFPLQKYPPNYQSYGSAGFLPKMNLLNEEVRDYLLGVADYWIKEFEIDGWRLDVPWKVPIGFWSQFRDVVKKANPNAYIVGEIWRDPKPWLDNNQFDGVMNYSLRNLVIEYFLLNKMDAEDFDYEGNYLRNCLHRDHQYFVLNLLGSHDTPRILTLCKDNFERLKLAMVFMFTYIGSPMIYYGDEVGIQGNNDPDCRRTMIWDRNQWNMDIFNLLKLLTELRINNEVLRRGDFETLLTFNGLYSFKRILGVEEVIIILNPWEEIHDLIIPMKRRIKTKVWYNVFSNIEYKECEEGIIIDKLKAPEVFILLEKNKR